MNQNTLRSIDLFSGAGLLSHAFHESGCRTLLAVEADPRALSSFCTNVGAENTSTDARTVLPGEECDILVAGPPCQGFSTLGKRDARDERNELSLCIPLWAAERQPKVVLVENVPPFLESRYWRVLKRRMKALGYESTQWVLNAADYGAPQLRVRAFGVFSKIGLPTAPVPTAQRHRTVREAFKGLPLTPDASGMHIAPEPGSLAQARFCRIPPRGDKRDLLKNAPELCPPSWQKMGAQATDVWGRINFDAPANTIRCCFQNASKGRYVHPTQDRVLTLREGARLQGIPDHWEFTGDRTSIGRQIGNGVPIALGTAIARCLTALFHH